MAFVKAERKRAKARVALAGPSGSGKSYSALLLARGLTPGGKIAAIDTEQGSLSLYSDMVDFDVCELKEYSPEAYIRILHEAEKAGYDTVIIDSLSHEWIFLLEEHDRMKGNSFTNWGAITPRHQALIEAMLQSPCHIIATMRSKTAYIQGTDKDGKTKVEKAGMAPQQRDGMEYEFTVTFDLDVRHIASSTKDRTRLFDGKNITITEQHGDALRVWLDSGAEIPTQAAKPAQAAAAASTAACVKCGVVFDEARARYAEQHLQGMCKKCFEAAEKGGSNGGDYTIKNPGEPASDKQKGMLARLFPQKGLSALAEDNWLRANYEVASKSALTKGQASDAITALMALPDAEEQSASLPLDENAPPEATSSINCTGDPNTCSHSTPSPGDDPEALCKLTGATCDRGAPEPETEDPFAKE